MTKVAFLYLSYGIIKEILGKSYNIYQDIDKKVELVAFNYFLMFNIDINIV